MYDQGYAYNEMSLYNKLKRNWKADKHRLNIRFNISP